jgi:hypothetical protein
MVYKLVPIRTKLSKDVSPLEMGQIDSELMYAKVMTWDWGNSESPDIYHDTETKRNSITYRTNLARLMNQLLLEDKKDKARNIINLAMTKMPVEFFGYYSLLEPFTDGYYKIGEKVKAQQLLQKLIGKYQENLNYYGQLKASEQIGIATTIIIDIERYRSLLQVMKENNDKDFYNKNKIAFNTYIKIFERFEREKE